MYGIESLHQRLILTFVEDAGGKFYGEAFCCPSPPFLIGLT